MRRALFAVSGTVVGLVLLLSFKTHPATVSTPPAAHATSKPGSTGGSSGGSGSTGSGSTGSGSTGSGSTGSGSTGGSGSSGGAAKSSGSKTITGDAGQTPYGPVQVQITVSGGSVTNVTAVDYPQGSPRDVQINSFAIPQLNQEATAAKSTNIDMVSGATYTSQGYIQSLQSALDQAGL